MNNVDVYLEVARQTGLARETVKAICFPLKYKAGPEPTIDELVQYINNTRRLLVPRG